MKYFKSKFLDFRLDHNMALLSLRSAQTSLGKVLELLIRISWVLTVLKRQRFTSICKMQIEVIELSGDWSMCFILKTKIKIVSQTTSLEFQLFISEGLKHILFILILDTHMNVHLFREAHTFDRQQKQFPCTFSILFQELLLSYSLD